MSFVNQLFIGIGATGAFFTLRETYLHTMVIEGRATTKVLSFHHCNLSQDADEAFAKAREFSERSGIELTTTRESLTEQMREIQRSTAEQMAQREAAQRASEEECAAARLAMEEAQREVIMSGRFPFGQYRDHAFRDAPRSYITWLAKSVVNLSECPIMLLLAEQVSLRCSDLVFPDADPFKLVGVIGERRTFKATVIRVRWFDGFYGRTYITTMVEDGTQACLLSKSSSFYPEEGAELEFKASIKEHSEYKGQAQTVVQRIKLVA